MNRKSLAKHMRDIHQSTPSHLPRRQSVSVLVGEFDTDAKRKAETSLSPPGNQPLSKREPPGDAVDSPPTI